MSFTSIIRVASLPAADWPLSIDEDFFFPRVERILTSENEFMNMHINIESAYGREVPFCGTRER